MAEPLPHLGTFSKAAELGSFTSAAKALKLTQPAVSQRVQALESLLKKQLFKRSGGRVALTDAGRTLYEHAQRILDMHRQAREAVSGQDVPLAGDLFLAASSIPGEHFLPDLVSQFRKSYLARGEPEEGWSVDDLKAFAGGLLTRILDANDAYIRRLLDLADGLPTRSIPRHGIYSRLFERTPDARVRHIVIASLCAEYHAARGSAPSAAAVRWMTGVLESLLPLPHNEIYQSYKETTNPIGKHQASFLIGRDPEELEAEDPPELLWKYVGRLIAQKLVESPWPDMREG
ncbi:hypothetical protein AYO40_01715 [Planctomycetaceae bacterium SCGC AG-212-D15]|nr:hypothetical protein AYO40_01715 [Planctomycetaceae bacterium SCGC AG-212-D15]